MIHSAKWDVNLYGTKVSEENRSIAGFSIRQIVWYYNDKYYLEVWQGTGESISSNAICVYFNEMI